MKKVFVYVIFCQLLSFFIYKREKLKGENMGNIDEEKAELCKRLWDECKEDLTNLCRYKLSSCPDEVDDVIADAFYYLCLAIYGDKPINNLKAWLIAVTNNLIKKKYSEINKAKAHRVSFYEENIDGYICEDDLFSEEVSDTVIDNLSSSVLSQLSEIEQLLYKYIYIDKLKMKEIAALLELTEVNVRQRHFRLSKKLKVLVKNGMKNL